MRVTELPRTTLGDLVLELSESGRVHKLLWDDAPPPAPTQNDHPC